MTSGNELVVVTTKVREMAVTVFIYLELRSGNAQVVIRIKVKLSYIDY